MATQLGAYAGKVLKIDVGLREVSEYPWTDEDRAAYLGGKIMAAKILYDNIKPGTDGFSPENMLVVSTGPRPARRPQLRADSIFPLCPLDGSSAPRRIAGNFGLREAGWLRRPDSDGKVGNALVD